MSIKKLTPFLLIFIISILAIGAWWMKEKNAEMKKVEEAQMATEELIRSNYKNIENISFESYEFHPLGGVFINGYLNDDKNKIFSIDYDFKTKEILSYAVDAEKRKECLDKVCE